MTDKEFVLNTFKGIGQEGAQTLREEAKDLTGTQIIDKEEFIPDFKNISYLGAPIGSPVLDNNQVWLLIQPYDASIHLERPQDLRSLWGLAHTKNPKKAKEFIASYGISGLYMKDECCLSNNLVYRCLNDNTSFSPTDLPTSWILVEN